MDDVRWLEDREQRAWRGLQMMTMRLEARLARELNEDSGVSYADYVVLVALTGAADGRLRPSELGSTLGWEQSRVSHHIARMAQRGLVERRACAEDRRGAFVAVTPDGRATIEAAAPGHVAAVRRWFVDLLTPEQLDAVGEASAVSAARTAADA